MKLRVDDISGEAKEIAFAEAEGAINRTLEAGPVHEFRIAGPFEDESIKREFNARAGSLKNIRYFGPLYGAEKEKFFEGLDAFVFPTHYRNEAEPLVLLKIVVPALTVVPPE